MRGREEGAGLSVDRLRIVLPPGYGARAGAIARATADELATMRPVHDFQADTLTVPPISISGGESNRQIARRIARSIQKRVAEGPAEGG